MYKFTNTAAAIVISVLLASPILALALDVGVGAEAGSVKATANANLQARITKGKDRADQEIDRRINALNVLNSRVQAMTKITSEAKVSINANIQSQITSLSALKARIEADTEIATLKADIQSITKSYRIFTLVIPQGRILVASDKLKSVASDGVTLASKISARIDVAALAGKDVAPLKSALADMQAKLADVHVQADAAVALVQTLAPDEGDAARADANDKALKDARSKVKAGYQDIEDARKNAHKIVKALADFKLDASASSSVSTQ